MLGYTKLQKLLIVIIVAIALLSCETKEQPKKIIDPYYDYTVEVKYTDNTKDTFYFNTKVHRNFYLRTESQDFSSARLVCFYAYYDKVACDVRTFKVIKETVINEKPEILKVGKYEYGVKTNL